MKIAVVGCGAVGSYYGGLLCRAGSEVHFLLRSDYEAVRRNGVQIQSPHGDFHFQPVAAQNPGEIGVADLVVIAIKTTANAELARLLPPLVGPKTCLITLQNGLGNEEVLEAIFPHNPILGGLCFVCLNRLEPGLIHHLAHGLIVLGPHNPEQQSDAQKVHDLFQHAGIPVRLSENLDKAHWEKLIWNIAFNGLGVAGAAGLAGLESGELPPALGPVLATDALLADPTWLDWVREIMREVISIGRARGHDIPWTDAAMQIERTQLMGRYLASTLIDFERGYPLELQSLFLAPLAKAHEAGLAVPRLEKLCRILAKLDPAARQMRA